MKFGIVLFPSKKLQDFANSYRKRYDPHYSLITPHLTLKEPFESTEEEMKAKIEEVHQLARGVSPFQLNVTKVSSFQPVNNVIFLKVEPVNELLELHQKLTVSFGRKPTEYAFAPHITIGQKLSNDEHTDVYSSLRMLDVRHEEIIDRFHLLYQLENGSWTVFETFHLGRE